MKKGEKRIVLIVLLLFVYVMMVNIVFAIDSSSVNHYYEVVVQEGDTLWAIAAEANQHHNKNMMDLVYLIADFNQLESGTIHPGQLIKVPLP